MTKSRVTVTVDDSLLDAANAAVAAGDAGSVSAWVSAAMADRLEKDRRLAALASLLADYEAEHGVIEESELVEQDELDRDAAARVRSRTRRAG